MDHQLLPPNSYYRTDNMERRAMSVTSSTSYQYTGEFLLDSDDKHSTPPESEMLLSDQDLANSLEAYTNLLQAAAIYREQMVQLSKAAAGFGSALERMAHGKTVSDAGQGLQAAAGLQFLISNHQQILSDMFDKTFEIPLRENLNHHTTIIKQSQENYESARKLMSKKIQETEAKNLRSGSKGQRDIRQFRKALQDLTRQVDELDRIKSEYQRHMIDAERKNHNFILAKVATIVRGQVDIYERVSNKGLADAVLEQMMHQNPDPFCAYSTQTDDTTEIFTVLPPVSLIDSHISQFGDQRHGFSDGLDDYGFFSGTMTPVTTHGMGDGGLQNMYGNSPYLRPEMFDGNAKETINKSHSASCLYDLPQRMQTLWLEKQEEKIPVTTNSAEEEDDRQSASSTTSSSAFMIGGGVHRTARKETLVGDFQPPSQEHGAEEGKAQ